jgi:hypothetical protein
LGVISNFSVVLLPKVLDVGYAQALLLLEFTLWCHDPIYVIDVNGAIVVGAQNDGALDFLGKTLLIIVEAIF